MSTAIAEKATKPFQERLGLYVSFTTAIVAAIAALCSLLMARHGGRSTSDLVQATNSWNYYQAKSLKSYILTSEEHLLEAMGKTLPVDANAKLAQLEEEKRKIKATAEAYTARSQENGRLGGILGNAVTLFQIAIANAAIAALAKRPGFWFVSVVLAAIGLVFVVQYWLQPAVAAIVQ
jgi:hypothetical protein